MRKLLYIFTCASFLIAGFNVFAMEQPSREDLHHALLIAASRGDREKVRELIGQGVDVNLVDHLGHTAINIPARKNDVAMVKFLLEAGLNVRANRTGGIALYEAAVRHHYEVVKLLLDAGAVLAFSSPQERQAFIAGQLGSLLQAKNVSDEDRKDLLERLRAAGLKSEHLREVVKKGGGVEAVRIILAEGGDVNASDDQDETPLMIVIKRALKPFSPRSSLFKIIDLLVGAGADINHVNNDGRTPLGHAAIYDYSGDLGEKLIKHGADIYQITTFRAKSLVPPPDGISWGTPLVAAAYYNSYLHMSEHILKKATKLTPQEKNSVKQWLLVDQRLRQEGRSVHKDLIMMVVGNIYRSLANDLRERVIRAGGLKALRIARIGVPREDLAQLLEKYLDLNFLECLVREQTMLPKR